MNFKLNPGGVILGLLGCYGFGTFGIVYVETDVPKFFFVVGLVGGALLGNFAWATWRRRKVAGCAHEWTARPELGVEMYQCPRCKAKGRQPKGATGSG
jgi:hypothetical protein